MSETSAALRTPDLERTARLAGQLREQIGRALIGQDAVVEQLLCALLAGGHVMIEGVPGVGKTLLARAFATAMDCRFARIQFTPDLMPSDIAGHALYDPKSEKFRIRRGPVFTNLLLADEINRAPAKTQSALLEVMQEGQVTVEGKSQRLEPPFMAIATQNPVEQEGTYPLPEAQLDRFLLKVYMEYPSETEEARLVDEVTTDRPANGFDLRAVGKVLDPAGVVNLQASVATVPVDEMVRTYAVRIAQATRQWPGLALGAGPRGSIALIRAARARAVLSARDFVIPDDVRDVALAALRHRVMLTPEMQIEGQRVDDVLGTLLDRVEAPRQ